jgi:hypothetical protein
MIGSYFGEICQYGVYNEETRLEVDEMVSGKEHSIWGNSV